MCTPLENISEPLLQWFTLHKRELPWRNDHEPYHVWISEIMLQQTRIEAVKKYYLRFMEALPDVESLSLVSEERLLKLWEGLGYYSRAKNLKKAAETIMSEYEGHFPSCYAQLIKLAGIGEYTAGAIASICFQEKVTAIDGNVLRVISRLTGSRKNVLLPETKKMVEGQLLHIMPAQSGAFNEALMELGEIVCLPNKAPLCEQCPLKQSCTAYRQELTAEIPLRIKTMKRTKEEKTILLLTDEHGRIAIEKRTAKGLLGGMYQLPNLEGFYAEEELVKILTDQQQLIPLQISFIKKTKHVFTHIDWLMKGYAILVKNITPDTTIETGKTADIKTNIRITTDANASNTTDINAKTDIDTKTDANDQTLIFDHSRLLWVSKEELQEAYPLPTAFRLFLSD